MNVTLCKCDGYRQVSLLPRGLQQVGNQGPTPSAPLCPPENIFGSSLSTHRLRRRRPLPSQRVSATASFPALEEADTKEKEAFLVLMGQLGTSHLPE
jgi:hypothetical protein